MVYCILNWGDGRWIGLCKKENVIDEEKMGEFEIMVFKFEGAPIAFTGGVKEKGKEIFQG